jgi:hypothetical protein
MSTHAATYMASYTAHTPNLVHLQMLLDEYDSAGGGDVAYKLLLAVRRKA